MLKTMTDEHIFLQFTWNGELVRMNGFHYENRPTRKKKPNDPSPKQEKPASGFALRPDVLKRYRRVDTFICRRKTTVMNSLDSVKTGNQTIFTCIIM